MGGTLETVRSVVGRRWRIRRAEMVRILAELSAAGLDLENPYLRESADQESAPQAWTRLCRGIVCISVDAGGTLRDGYIRFDEPGRMHPMQYAELLFAPASLGDSPYDQIGHVRLHADRVLVVDNE